MDEQPELQVYLNGRVMPHGQAVAEMKEGGLESVGGFYDTERTFNGRTFKLREHLHRLYNGLDHTKIDPGMTLDEMASVTLDLLAANLPLLSDGQDFTVSQVVSLMPDPSREDEQRVNVVIYCQSIDFTAFAPSYVKGVRVVTPDTYGVQPRGAAADPRRGGQQVFPLMVDAEGSLTECKGGNFMFVSEGRIKLPDRGNVLPGVSMQTILELADSLGVAVDEDDYSTYDVYVADEAFVSSTRLCMVPVDTINGLRLSGELPGPLTRRLLSGWSELVGVDFVQQALDTVSGDDGGSPAP